MSLLVVFYAKIGRLFIYFFFFLVGVDRFFLSVIHRRTKETFIVQNSSPKWAILY